MLRVHVLKAGGNRKKKDKEMVRGRGGKGAMGMMEGGGATNVWMAAGGQDKNEARQMQA